jgi:hypothetical protein
MKTLLLFIAFGLSISIYAQPNLIINGMDWSDTNHDQLADNWTKGGYVYETHIYNGCQIIESNTDQIPCSSICILQYTQRAAGSYLFTFSLWSNTIIFPVILTNDSLIILDTITPALFQEYSFEFPAYSDFYAIGFVSKVTTANCQIDNVELFELFPVGINELSVNSDIPKQYYNMLGQQLQREPDGGFYLVKQGLTTKKYFK